MHDFDGAALVTGGQTGIGKATAQRLIAMGLDVDAPGRNIMDVTSRDDIRNYLKSHGPFTHIVYSAGFNRLAWVKDAHITFLMEDMYQINCVGFVTLISEHILQFPTAYLSAVAVSSDASRIPMRGSVAYCASKAALSMAVRTMARELAPLHRINAVAPGMVEGTPMTEYIDATVPGFRSWTPEQARSYERQGTPTGRRATLAEVAETIAWVLTGPEQMTGAVIDVNGGR